MRNVKRTIRVPTREVIAELATPPQWVEPELCKLVAKIPAGDGWAHEIKFDGFRMHARIVNGVAALLTRNGLDWTAKNPDIAAAIGGLNCRQAYLDGELCAVLSDGTTSFSTLQGHGDTPADAERTEMIVPGTLTLLKVATATMTKLVPKREAGRV
jgi:ATP-dependent DNA ligase